MDTISGRRRLALGTLLAMSIALLSSAPQMAVATVEEDPPRSPLCAYLDRGAVDYGGTVSATFTLGVGGQLGQLYGGETITFMPGTVAQPEEVVLSLSVRTNGSGFDPVAISGPGASSVSWTAPRTTLTGLRSAVSTGNVEGMTWSCVGRPAGPATAIDELRGEVAEKALHGGLARALDG
jgi:hypothetical protein